MYARRWIGVENDPQWLKVAQERLNSTAVLDHKPTVGTQGESDLFAE
jgi:hypothetical protein